MKTMITVYLDGELVAEARAKNLKFSELFNNTLRTALDMQSGEPQEMAIDDKIINVKARLLSLEAEKKRIEEENKKKNKVIWRSDNEFKKIINLDSLK